MSGRPPAYNAEQQQSRKDALFNLSNRTLAATSEWRLVIRLGLLFAAAAVFYNFYWMDIQRVEKALGFVCFLFVCYAAVNLSSMVRNREEAKKLELFARHTDLYGTSNVKTLKGSDTKYAFQYIGFFTAFIAMIASFWYVEMPAERRGNFMLSGTLLLIMSFMSQKDVRDKEDSDKWHADYFGQELREE
jgi:hypothetical protein